MCPPPMDRGGRAPGWGVQEKCCGAGREEKRARGWGGRGDTEGAAACVNVPRSLFCGFIRRASMGLI